ncbi:MAG: MFS transporter [Clostridiales bacterium]|nr:MFS transporter [Clostridiales bacterium]
MNKKELRNLNAHYAASQGALWAGFAIIWGFLSVVLLHYGFTGSQIGIISSISLLLSIFVQPPLAALADRSIRITSRYMTIFLASVGLAACLVLWLFAGQRSTLIAVLFIVIGIVITVIPPFMNTMAMEFVLNGIPLNFGMGRGVGSFFYGLSVLIGGFLIEKYDPRLVMPLFLVFFSTLILVVYLFRHLPDRPREPDSGEHVLTNLQLIRQYPRYALTLVACAFLMAGHSPVCTYMNFVVEKAGGGASAMGTALAIAAFMELPAMSLFETFKKHFSVFGLFRFCAAMFVVRNLIFLAASSVAVIYINPVLNFFEYGIFLPATVYYVSAAIDGANQVKGQALIHTAAAGVGSAFGALCSGLLLDRAGVSGMLIFTTLCSAVGFGIIWISTRRRKEATI